MWEPLALIAVVAALAAAAFILGRNVERTAADNKVRKRNEQKRRNVDERLVDPDDRQRVRDKYARDGR